MKIMGVDPSTRTGVVVLENSPEYVRYSSEIPCNAKHRGFPRSLLIMENFHDILTKENPDLVVFEAYGYGSQSLALMVEIGTLLRLCCVQYETSYIEVAPTKLKKIITGKGNAGKELMMLDVYKRFSFDASTNNIADAFGLAIVGLIYKGYAVQLPKVQLQLVTRNPESLL